MLDLQRPPSILSTIKKSHNDIKITYKYNTVQTVGKEKITKKPKKKTLQRKENFFDEK